MKNYNDLSWNDIKAMFAEVAQLSKENEQKLDKMAAEHEKEWKKICQESAKTDRKLGQSENRVGNLSLPQKR